MMSKVIVLVFSLVGLFSFSVSLVIQDGQCDEIPLQQNFDVQRFLGTWEEYARTDNTNQQGECSTFQFTNTNGLGMVYSAVNNNFLEEVTGTVTQKSSTASFWVTIPSFPDPLDFSVLQTLMILYDTFATTFSCRDISPTQRQIHIWVIKRPEIIMNDLSYAYIDTALRNAFSIEFSTLRTINHDAATCFVLPIIEPGEPIIFPGQCDTKLSVVQQFDVDKFSGLWHQISSYETPNGNGACARAEFSRGRGGILDIINSQVVNQELVTIKGEAALLGSEAKLSVLFDIPGSPLEPRDLWILRSDYNNYAVAYTCVNEGDSRRRVYSWILSRSRRLSPAAQLDVDEAIRSYLDLNSVYYRPTDQSDEGCFYYPEPSKEPVVFRGQCESVNVKPMENFAADRYMGTWHTIEMYPSRHQDGSCSNAFYDLVDGEVKVVNSQVKNQRLETVKGVGVPASDGSAKLVVTFPNPGTDEPISTEYWILDTDYTNYALVYSCQNLNENDMQVNTWKLSNTKQLLPEYEQVIDDFISSIPYLNNIYYNVEDQSEIGCFYFPEPQDNVPVVFPGQCEEPVAVESFDFAQFIGTWYEIESYPKYERTGQCVNHEFSFLDSARLNLLSSSVADQFKGELNGVVSRSSSADNSGRLTITITDDDGIVKNIPFWVLSTVYNDYAFAYGCQNIDDDSRAVWSWKLSRTMELSTAATTAISNAMTTNVVLADEYFEKIDHSNDACFYLPEIVPGEPVILLGQCDRSIVGVSDFNIGDYAGRWRLIDSYGADFQEGTCNVAQYSQQESNVLAIKNTQVVNGQLQSIAGTATVTSTDGSGQLTFNLGGESFDVIILATDYNSYSLGYGCVDLPDNQRRVYSWKMSRENTLSEGAINSMNEIIDRIQVLNNRFYYRIDRTDTGCFYFPTPDPNTSVKFRGQCENIPVVTDFKPEKYLGTWYDIESYPGDFQNGQCNTATYSEHPEAGVDVDVYNTQVINEALMSIRGTAVQDPSTDGSAKLTVSFNVGGNVVTSNYWVVATDYESYALVYSCQPVDDEYVRVTSWKLSRTRQLAPEDKTKIDEAMSDIRALDQQYFIERDQSREACFYYPEPQPGVPVVFPGQCDENIEAVPNFNMNLFQGTWHEIAAYPKANQDGQCFSQQFAVNATNSMRLDSFSVLDLAQSTTEGHVTFASDDDLSGKLDINIWVDGEAQRIPYWILSTDYNNYALAYSCVNIDDDTRGVWSWKLSKTRQLSDENILAIDDAIAKVDVLRNDYYENIQQTDTACFHLPDITPGDNVVLPGQCDLSIAGIADFDISKYAGEWRLIENYGSPYQGGTCNVARYTQQASNELAITNSQVVDGQLVSISGTAAVTSTDGSGQLTFSIGNRQYIISILDTDYDTFALAYGCDNVGDDQRRVTSWKFSRFNTLSPQATERINEIIDGIEVLHQPYYYHVNRSPYACFYFPEPDRHTPVRFRGQCDHHSVTVVPEFDVKKYMGVWYDIESYPVVFQNGECPNARYTALDSNTVSVYNTHVVDQSLGTINGVATVASTDGSAKLKVTFDGQNPDAASDYWVLSTNYESYAFVYSCTNDGEDYMNVASWKLSRTRQLAPEDKTKIDEAMSDIRALDQQYFIERDQSREACFYYPEPQPGVPVVFPGQCDESIEAVPNFNMNLFQGTWHEIAAYPKANQDGQCFSQQFAVNATNSMRLDSFSVLDLAQSATEGHVTFASDDDLSGKLDINIWVDGEAQSIPYWILSTDYNNYALAYSCVNIDDDTRGVWSWKLSKTRQLSDENILAINDAIAKVDVLRNDYYENIQQTDTACFHLPDITPGDNVILPGQCDLSIAGIADFDISKYAGEWRLIENYGSPYQGGTCNVARYTQQASNELAITNSQVVDGQLISISGTATVTSTDGSGQLTFSIANRQYIISILDTDYDTFALAYGCDNVGDDQRRVTSWKFSRFNTLSPQATERINEIIDGIEVLHQPYYYHVNRSPYACFYFPEPDRHTPVRFRGQCDHHSVTVVPEFDVEKYMGVWYDIESYPVVFQNGECPNARYTALDSNTVSVYNTHVVDQSLGTINGVATVASTDGSAKLKVTFDGQNPDAASDYWVLSTNYESYAFVYSCTNDGEDYMNVASWKLSRTRQLEPEDKPKIDEVMSDIRTLDQQYFIERDQSREACFYYPEPQPGVPVVFPGQCDESIEAVPNFNMNLFQGTWHEIAAYPKANQDGQCFSQKFAVNATNSMRLDSLSVLDLAQSATEGHVTFASDDDLSGKLDINIWVDGEAQSIPYWILSTDYNNYALAYSCVNIDDDTRGVWSWKLSKTRQLSDENILAIDAAIANVDVLSNDYYENIQQTDTACFYYPELGPTDPVVFPGRCNPNIPVVQNFDASRYQGRWRLLESYYSDFQEGACNAANYSVADDGSVIVVNSKVVDEELISVTGTAVPDASGSGKLTVTFPNSAPEEYWILTTDYATYALIYTCVDLPNDQRRVWSWKLSRLSSFSVETNNVINEIINNIDVLHARYYQPIDRSEVGCFYYPPPPTPESMFYSLRFPGQCEESIPIEDNFNAELYSGPWFDVESYPSNLQRGTCNTASYTYNPNGTLTVHNTQVVGQLLQTVTGIAVPTTTDGSAKFDVTLNDGTEMKYWVLSTDYYTYSLVYSCRDLDDEYREEQAESTINDVIEKVQVLDEDYFISRTHTDKACFYYPDNDGGDVIMDGRCLPDADVPAVTNFDPNGFSGTWYEVSRYPSDLQNGECTASEYVLNIVNNIFDVVQTSVVDEEELRTDTQAIVASNGRGVISMNVNGVPHNVYILATVNTDYAVLYSCRELDASRKQLYSWKLSRSRTGLSEAATSAIDELISTNIDLHEPYYRKTGQDQASCFHYPEFDDPPSIELPGPCDESITGVSGLNMNALIGTWYEVARYPQPTQTGQCNRVVFESGDTTNVFNVVHRQVTDEALGESFGQAAVTGDDGQIELTFNVGEETRTAKYYVLTTDYNNYALIYSCVNIDGGERRRVGSWKLSKTTELSSQANAVMDDIITNTQGLRQQYYQDTSQSDAACFYYPEFVEPPPYIELPGLCDQSITGVTNFNVENLIGTWYEVARYPQPTQTGQCNRVVFESGDTTNVFNVVHRQVTDEALGESSGQAAVTGDDGQIEVTFNVGDETRTAKYYVLTTDYNNYALIYSCVNIDGGESRRVGSWKLSKTTELSSQANAAMDDIITNTQGLRQQYYQDTSQSDAACFYYPEFVEPPPYIELPGLCDQSITGVTNFNVENFLGKWFEVARYPEPAQTGQCNLAEFVAGSASGSFSIETSQIVDVSLLEITGEATIASSDGSGRLTVTYNSGGSYDYYVLATDYTGFALVYTCINIPSSNRRRVFSWKLSRNTELSVDANNTIDDIIDTTQGLRHEYYQHTSHSAQACFHYPTQTGDRVVLPGQCDTEISAMESFNVARFANNSWYQIRRYDAVGGRSCVGTRLSFDDETGDIEVLNFEVVDDDLITTEGSGRLNSNDGSGTFSLVLNDSEGPDDENTETTIYILGTDYDGYALAYSCKNINSNQREVGAWELSRGRTMSEASNAAITDIINDRPELHEPYFNSISQREECLEPSSAFFFKSSIILIFVCTVLHLLW